MDSGKKLKIEALKAWRDLCWAVTVFFVVGCGVLAVKLWGREDMLFALAPFLCGLFVMVMLSESLSVVYHLFDDKN